MSYAILDSSKGVTSNTTLGSVFTYEVITTGAAEVRFEGTNADVFPTTPTVIVTFTASGVQTQSSVLQHSWQRIRAVVVSGTPAYYVASEREQI
jgi:hypothetical protein